MNRQDAWLSMVELLLELVVSYSLSMKEGKNWYFLGLCLPNFHTKNFKFQNEVNLLKSNALN